MTARIRGQAAVPTEESPAQFRHRILTALGKLDDRDAQGRATDELKQVIDELTTEQLPALLGCLHDALAKAGSVHAKREHIRLFAVLCSVHGDAMAPHLPKAIAVIIKTLKEGDAQSVEVCVDALALMSKTVTSAVQPTAFAVPDEASYPLSVFLRPLFKLLTDQTKPSQSGAALALGRVLEANHRAIPGLLHHTMPLLLKALTLTYFVAGAQLLVAVQHCILTQGAREEVLEYVPALMDVLINTARSAQWTNRKAAFDTLRVLAQCLGAAMNSYRDDVLRLLNELRYDKIRAVREAVAGAQQTFQELGASLSPTKVPLREPEERPIRAHATVSRPAPSRASPAPSPLRSPAASRSHSSLGSRTPTKAAAKSTLTSLPVHVVASHSTSSSAASGDSATLEDIARTVHQMQAQQAAFMGEVRAHLERLDHRLRAVESRLPAAPRAAAAATDADVVAAEAVAESNGEAGPGAEAEEGEEDEAKLMARIAELEAEEEEANEGLED